MQDEYQRRIDEYFAKHTQTIGRCRVEPYDVTMKERYCSHWSFNTCYPAARSWAVYLNGELLVVTLFLKGALAVANALNV